jgi:hypothetical protein
MLVEGFGEENVERLASVGDEINLNVFRYGKFVVDATGNIKMPDGLPEELYYWVDLDLRSLDIMRGGGV